jgi:hypothetical protein
VRCQSARVAMLRWLSKRGGHRCAFKCIAMTLPELSQNGG